MSQSGRQRMCPRARSGISLEFDKLWDWQVAYGVTTRDRMGQLWPLISSHRLPSVSPYGTVCGTVFPTARFPRDVERITSRVALGVDVRISSTKAGAVWRASSEPVSFTLRHGYGITSQRHHRAQELHLIYEDCRIL